MLTKIAIYGGVASVAGAFFCYNAIQVNLASGGYYTESLRILQDTPAALSELGKPLRPTYLDLGNRENLVSEKEARLIIPVKGSKSNGLLRVEASRNLETSLKWNIDRLQLDLDSGKRIVIVERMST